MLLRAYRNLEIYYLVREGGDGVVEAESVFAGLCRCEDIVALSLLLAAEDDPVLAWLFFWPVHFVVNYCQLLAPCHSATSSSSLIERTVKVATALHSKVEGNLGVRLVDVCVEAFVLVGCEFVCERCR